MPTPPNPSDLWHRRAAAELIARATELKGAGSALLQQVDRAESRVKDAYEAERRRIVDEQLSTMPLGRLKKAAGRNVRLGVVEDAGYRTVGDALRVGRAGLERIHGVGPVTSNGIISAARGEEAALRDAAKVRFNVDARPSEQTVLLIALRDLDSARRRVEPMRARIEKVVAAVDADFSTSRILASRVRRVLARRERRQQAVTALNRLDALLKDAETVGLQEQIRATYPQTAHRQRRPPTPSKAPAASRGGTTAEHRGGHGRRPLRAQRPDQGATADVWDDYMARPVEYNGLLAEIVGLEAPIYREAVSKPRDPRIGRLAMDPVATPAPVATEARRPEMTVQLAEDHIPRPRLPLLDDIPEEIIAKIRRLNLDTTLLRASLRGYQMFGAKFAVVQRRTILGDEMGLGKTIEALAVMCHLRSFGQRHFLIICPASVLINWEREIARHSQLEPTWRLHGILRDDRLRDWARRGGVAITTFDTLKRLHPPQVEIAVGVIDEAHFVKNIDAQRTRTARRWLDRADRALLMTGTPMENRVEELRTLVRHVQPGVARTLGRHVRPAEFRRRLASVYLRRNQEDVLSELPERIETKDWVDLTDAAAAVYRQAVAARNFQLMRRAAFMTPSPVDSPKLRRLLEIVEEAASNGRKVLVFSFFRDVIQRTHSAVGHLTGRIAITGSVSAPERQRLIDEFSAPDGPAVLVSQIEAGGSGLNIQAASVVILTEPQWKPSTEEQAIARAHRLGQVRPVQIHRLLAENCVDSLMLEVLAHKSALFDSYARASALKSAAPEAIDPRVAAEHIIERERRRLGLAA